MAVQRPRGISRVMRIAMPFPASLSIGMNSQFGPWARGSHGSLRVEEFQPASGVEVRGGLLLIQEIFGLNAHIREDAALWAARGFRVWAPAYFDLVTRDATEPGPELEYRDRDFVLGRSLAQSLGFEAAALVSGRLMGELRQRLRVKGETDRVMCLGYCWGGAVAFLAAARGQGHERPDAFVSYYGRAVYEFRSEVAKVPGVLHYGERDSLIPLDQVEAVREAQPQHPVYTYPAGHGFNRRGHADFDPESAQLAVARNLELWQDLETRV